MVGVQNLLMTKFLLFFENILLLNYPGFCLQFFSFLSYFFPLPPLRSFSWFVANCGLSIPQLFLMIASQKKGMASTR